MPFATVNPTTGQTVRTFETHSPAEVEARLARSQAAFLRLKQTTFPERAAWMRRAAELLEANAETFARQMTEEMGKTVASGRAEVQKCAATCRYYADHAARMLADEPLPGVDGAFLRYQPLGAILAVMPWNFPFWQAIRFAVPALMAGNVGLLKHAPNVPQCALALESLFLDAGFPEGGFQNLFVETADVARLIEDPRVKAVTLTGSGKAGADVASRAARVLKKAVLELGGSDPFIVMPSANLEKAVDAGVKARLLANGQSCIAAKRFIVHASIADAFEQAFVARMKSVVVGDPLDARTELGPLSSATIRSALDTQVQQSVKAGARRLLGGTLPEGPGFFYPATVLADPPVGSPAYAEELFGPVATLFRVPDVDAAIALANDTGFGLGASVWTEDAVERDRLVDGIESGMVFVNALVASEAALPFGGVKNSGFGRELSHLGIREFLNVKTVKQA